MATAELHFFASDDLNGTAVYTCTTDDDFLLDLELELSHDSLGMGRITFGKQVGEDLLSAGKVAPETFVRVLVPAVSATRYLWGFFLDAQQQNLIDRDEEGGEGLVFGGPGPKFYLSRAVLWHEDFGSGGARWEPENGVVRWSDDAPHGAILRRLLLEDGDNPYATFLPDLTHSFTHAVDSAATPWPWNIAGEGEMTLGMGENLLKLMHDLEAAGDLETDMYLGTVATPLLRLDAYSSPVGRDLTATIELEEGVNIIDTLEVEVDALLRGTHAVVKGDKGTWEKAVLPGWTAASYAKAVGFEYSVSDNVAILERAGIRHLKRKDLQLQEMTLRIQPGFDTPNGLYMPGPAGTSGHIWYGDSISLTTGLGVPGALDYVSVSKRIYGIHMELAAAVRDDTTAQAARSWQIQLELDKVRSRDAGGGTGEGGTEGHSAGCCGPDSAQSSPSSPEVTTVIQAWTWPTLGVGEPITNPVAAGSPSAWNQGGATGNFSNPMSTQPCVSVATTAKASGMWYATAGTTYRIALRTKNYNHAVITADFYNAGTLVSSETIAAPSPPYPYFSASEAEVDYEIEVTAPAGTDRMQINKETGSCAIDNVYVWSVDSPAVVGTDPTEPVGSGPSDAGTSSGSYANADHVHEHGTHASGDMHPEYATDADLTTHAAAADPHTGYVREADASWVDLTDGGPSTLHTHASGGTLDSLSDVTVTAAATGDMLRYNGTAWVDTPGRWEPVTNGVDTFVWDGAEIVMEWKDT